MSLMAVRVKGPSMSPRMIWMKLQRLKSGSMLGVGLGVWVGTGSEVEMGRGLKNGAGGPGGISGLAVAMEVARARRARRELGMCIMFDEEMKGRDEKLQAV